MLVAVVSAALLVLGAPTAGAHDGLVGTNPAGGSSVAAAPDAVELEFTGEPLPIGTLVAVTGPGGDAVSDGDAEIRGTTVVQRLTGGLTPGAYRVAWRSTSSDGHALSGTFDFAVDGAAPAPPATTAGTGAETDTAPASATAPDDGGIAPVWLVAGAVVLLGLGALLVTRVRRRG